MRKSPRTVSAAAWMCVSAATLPLGESTALLSPDLVEHALENQHGGGSLEPEVSTGIKSLVDLLQLVLFYPKISKLDLIH